MTTLTATQSTTLAPLALGFLLADGAAVQAKAALPPVQPVDTLPARAAGTAVERGKAELRAGRPADAVAAFREALAADPQSVEALSGMAIAYDQLGRYDLSRPLYEAALILDPRAPVLLYNYGLSLSRQRDRAGALRFLSLAAAGGDAEVETAALRLIAALDPEQAMRRPAAPAAPAMSMAAPAAPAAAATEAAAPSATAVPAAAAAPAATAIAAPAAPLADVATAAARATGPALVRTSEHEVRLVLTPAKVAPAPLVAELGPDALAALPVSALSAGEEAAIHARAAAAEAADREAAFRAEAAARERAALAALPPALRDTLAATVAAARAPRPAPPAAAAEAVVPVATRRPGPGDPAPADRRPTPALRPDPSRGQLEASQILALALAQPAVAVSRRTPPVREAQLLPPAEPQPRAKRAFEAPFESDDARLNALARRLHQPDADRAIAVARLQGLLDRLQAA